MTGQTEGFYIYGSRSDSHIISGAGDDYIYGGDDDGAGNDLIIGGLGADTLTGGAGNDVFWYKSILDSPNNSNDRDTITDFTSGEDTLKFEGLLHGNFAYLGSGAFSGSGNSEARLDGNTNTLYVDTLGSGGANMEIVLENAYSLTAEDFEWSVA